MVLHQCLHQYFSLCCAAVDGLLVLILKHFLFQLRRFHQHELDDIGTISKKNMLPHIQEHLAHHTSHHVSVLLQKGSFS